MVDVSVQTGWSKLRRRDALKSITSEMVLRECEALLITVMGSRGQNVTRFQEAKRWAQLSEADFVPGGIGRKVSEYRFTDREVRNMAQQP